jgi:hypothetical protein
LAYKNSDINHWIAGFLFFVTGEGFIHTSKSKPHKLGISVALNFFVLFFFVFLVKKIRVSYLLASFSQIFGCGSFNIVEKSEIVKI